MQIQRVLTDNAKADTEPVAFTETAAGLGILLRRTRRYRPQTNGKVERFHRTLLEEWAYARLYRSNAERRRAFTRWLRFYDHRRPHTALDGLTRWRSSSTTFTGNTAGSRAGGQFKDPLRVTVVERWMPLVPAPYGTRVARPVRMTRHTMVPSVLS